MSNKKLSKKAQNPPLSKGAVSGSFYIGQKVRTIHGDEGEIEAIYSGGKFPERYPYVIKKFRDGKTYMSDYSANQLVAL